MRALAEGRIKWAFRPPGDDSAGDIGLLIAERHPESQEAWNDDGSDEAESETASDAGSTPASDATESEEDVATPASKTPKAFGGGRFGVLLDDEAEEAESSGKE